MAIKEAYENKVRVYNVSVSLRSKLRKGIRAQKHKRNITTLRQAQAIEKELIREASMDLARMENQTLKWSELLEKFELTMRTGSATQRPMQANILRETMSFIRSFTEAWMKRDCRDIHPGDVRIIINSMEKQNYSNGRMRGLKSVVNAIFRFGMESGLLNGVHASPAESVKLAKFIDDKPPQILNIKEIHRLLAAAKAQKHPWYPIWFTALNTGMRSGELHALEWSDVDWDNRLLTVSKSWNGRLKAVKSTKAGYWRKVPINSELESLLKNLRAETPMHQRQVLPRVSRWGNGEQAKYLREFCIEIGISSVNFHALRACFATHLLNAGVSSPVVKKICGWTEEKVMTRYIRLAGLDVTGATQGLGFKVPEFGPQAEAIGGNVFSIGTGLNPKGSDEK